MQPMACNARNAVGQPSENSSCSRSGPGLEPMTNTAWPIPKDNRAAQGIVEIHLGLNHGIRKRGTLNEGGGDGGTEGAAGAMGVRRGNGWL